MKSLDFSRYAQSCAAIALLAGCGGSQPPIGAQQAQLLAKTIPESQGIERDSATGSWMLPEAKGEDLLYVTNYSDVLVYSYPEAKLVGELKKFYSAAGECVDANGDVFVTNFKPVTVYEYAHGGTKRIAEFPTKKAGTTGCAISPVNGDLAITGGINYLEIFRGAKGKPVVLRDSGMFVGTFATYDDKGNLFFVGLADPNGDTRLSELPSGATKFVAIKLTSTIFNEAAIQWDNPYLTAISFVPFTGTQRKTELFRFRISGTKAIKVGETPLGKPADIVLQYFIDGKTLIAPNLDGSDGQYSDVLFYNYSAGGSPFLILTKHVSAARGVVVSLASK